MPSNDDELDPRVIFKTAALVFVGFVLLIASGKLFEHIGATEIAVVQAPFSGNLTWYTDQGVKWQGGGSITTYVKRMNTEFEREVRFNDGGHGTMVGSIQWEMPMDAPTLTKLHQQFGSQEAIKSQLVDKVVTKSIYMTGPLMSSKESYAEKRNYLINYVEDQIENGVYKTIQHEVKVVDPITGQEKTAVVVDIQMANGAPVRQEKAVLAEYGIRTSNFAITNLKYDGAVEKQIQQQQQIAMDVQTAIAEARKAEQRKLTVEQQGAADAAKARWEQETVKAKEVTAAEQRLAVAELDRKTAEQEKLALIAEGQGQAEKRRLIMSADNALQARLDAYIKVNETYADAIKNVKQPLVPGVMMGGGGGSAASVTDLIALLTAKTAKEVGVEAAK